MTTRKKYSKEFKLDAISLVNYNNVEAARKLGIRLSVLGNGLEKPKRVMASLSEAMIN